MTVYILPQNQWGKIVDRPTGSVSEIHTVPGVTSIKIFWSDPLDRYWSGTKLIRKEGSSPENENDGIVLTDSRIRNQYKYSSDEGPCYVDEGLTTDKTYYYGLFPHSRRGIVTNNEAGRFSATTKAAVDESLSDPIILNGFDTLTDSTDDKLAENARSVPRSVRLTKTESSTSAQLPSDTSLWEKWTDAYGDITATFKTDFDLTTEESKIRPFILSFGSADQSNMHKIYIHNLITPEFLGLQALMNVMAVVPGIDLQFPYDYEDCFCLILAVLNDGEITHTPMYAEIVDKTTFKIVIPSYLLYGLIGSSESIDQIGIADPL